MLVQADLLMEYRSTEALFLNTILWGDLWAGDLRVILRGALHVYM